MRENAGTTCDHLSWSKWRKSFVKRLFEVSQNQWLFLFEEYNFRVPTSSGLTNILWRVVGYNKSHLILIAKNHMDTIILNWNFHFI